MHEPGTYRFFLQTEGQSSTIGVGYRPDTGSSWGKSEVYLSGWRTENKLYYLEFHLSDTSAHMVVKLATENDGFLEPTNNVMQDERLTLEKPCYPWVVVCGIMHRSWLRARWSLKAGTWSPSEHTSLASKGFRKLVMLLFLLRNEDTTVLSALPRELMFLVLEQLWHSWSHDDDRALSLSRGLSSSVKVVPPTTAATTTTTTTTTPDTTTTTPDTTSDDDLVIDQSPLTDDIPSARSKKRCLLQ